MLYLCDGVPSHLDEASIYLDLSAVKPDDPQCILDLFRLRALVLEVLEEVVIVETRETEGREKAVGLAGIYERWRLLRKALDNEVGLPNDHVVVVVVVAVIHQLLLEFCQFRFWHLEQFFSCHSRSNNVCFLWDNFNEIEYLTLFMEQARLC